MVKITGFRNISGGRNLEKEKTKGCGNQNCIRREEPRTASGRFPSRSRIYSRAPCEHASSCVRSRARWRCWSREHAALIGRCSRMASVHSNAKAIRAIVSTGCVFVVVWNVVLATVSTTHTSACWLRGTRSRGAAGFPPAPIATLWE